MEGYQMNTTDILIAYSATPVTLVQKYSRVDTALNEEEAVNLFFRNHYDAIIIPQNIDEDSAKKLLRIFQLADEDTQIISQPRGTNLENLTLEIIEQIKAARRLRIQLNDNALANAKFNINIIQ